MPIFHDQNTILEKKYGNTFAECKRSGLNHENLGLHFNDNFATSWEQILHCQHVRKEVGNERQKNNTHAQRCGNFCTLIHIDAFKNMESQDCWHPEPNNPLNNAQVRFIRRRTQLLISKKNCFHHDQYFWIIWQCRLLLFKAQDYCEKTIFRTTMNPGALNEHVFSICRILKIKRNWNLFKLVGRDKSWNNMQQFQAIFASAKTKIGNKKHISSKIPNKNGAAIWIWWFGNGFWNKLFTPRKQIRLKEYSICDCSWLQPQN